jgi:Ni/Co efflux regulator RcnB
LDFAGKFKGGMMIRILKSIFASIAVLFLFTMGPAKLMAQDSAKQDMKDAGHETKDAAKDTGRAVKKTAKKTGHEVKKGTHKAAKKTEHAADKVEDKTE